MSHEAPRWAAGWTVSIALGSDPQVDLDKNSVASVRAAGRSPEQRLGSWSPSSLRGSTGNFEIRELGHRVRLGPEPDVASGERSVVMI
jgi:hypothetical protein